MLEEGAARLGLDVVGIDFGALLWLADELLKWNQRFNLTAITQPAQVQEKHLVDSLSVLRVMGGRGRVLDVGAGAGFPGLVLALARPGLEVTLIEAVNKKVSFMKHVIAQRQLAGRVTAFHGRAEGQPAHEGLFRYDWVVARALMDLEPWLSLGAHYVEPKGGRVVAMMGKPPSAQDAGAWAVKAGLVLEKVDVFALPWSHDPRALVVARAP